MLSCLQWVRFFRQTERSVSELEASNKDPTNLHFLPLHFSFPSGSSYESQLSQPDQLSLYLSLKLQVFVKGQSSTICLAVEQGTECALCSTHMQTRSLRVYILVAVLKARPCEMLTFPNYTTQLTENQINYKEVPEYWDIRIRSYYYYLFIYCNWVCTRWQ
jgi:hypothetical protein